MEKDGPIIVDIPIKPWWPGDPRVESFMPPVSEAIRRHINWPSEEYTDIYNRAYEAVYNAIVKYADEKTSSRVAGPTRSKKRRRRK